MVTPGDFQNGGAVRSLLLLEHKRPISRTQQAIGAGDHIKLIIGLLLSGVMYQQETDFLIICKPFQPSHNLIIIGIAELLPTSLSDFLKGVNDNQLCIRMLSHKLLKLFIQAGAKLFGEDGKVQILCAVCSKHPI